MKQQPKDQPAPPPPYVGGDPDLLLDRLAEIEQDKAVTERYAALKRKG